MARQHAAPSRTQASKSSVWIDPTVSTYLQSEQSEQTAQPSQPSQPLPTSAKPHMQVEPTTPIPPRASAQRSHAVRIRPRYSYVRTEVSVESDLTRTPTLPPPTTWEYESQEYSAESSLSSLSLIVDEPTNPLTDIPVTADTPPHGMPRIEDIDTRPPVIAKSTIEGIVDSTISNTQLAIEEQNTVPMQLSPARVNPAQRTGGTQLPGAASLFLDEAILPVSPVLPNNVSSRALAPVVPAIVPTVMESQNRQIASAEPSSWTAGAAAGSRYAQLVAARTGRMGRRKHISSFNVFDRLRWWLLHPGRFEFLLWLGGTVLLMTVTCIFVLMTVFSFQWSVANTNNSLSSSSNSTNSPASGRTTSPGGSLALTNAGPLVAGSLLHLRGQGFSANGHVALTYDANQLFLNQNRQPVLAQTDAHGTFAVTLNSPAWGMGQHRITARDLATGHVKSVLVTVTAASIKKAAVTPVVAAATATTPIQQGSNTPPIIQTPTVVPPTLGITPTAAPKPPTPTPTRGITPTATARVTPTVGASVTPKVNGTATVGNTNPATVSSQDIAASGELGIAVGPWLWLLIGGYALAMLLFGLAGLARK